MKKTLHQYGPDKDTIAFKVCEAAKIQKVESVRFYRHDESSTYGYLTNFRVDPENFDETAFTERLNASLDGIVLMNEGRGSVGRLDRMSEKTNKYEVTVEVKPKK